MILFVVVYDATFPQYSMVYRSMTSFVEPIPWNKILECIPWKTLNLPLGDVLRVFLASSFQNLSHGIDAINHEMPLFQFSACRFHLHIQSRKNITTTLLPDNWYIPGRVVYNPSFHKKQPDLRFFLVGLSYICRPHIYLNGRHGSCLRSNKIKHLFGFLISNKNIKMQTWTDSATGPK